MSIRIASTDIEIADCWPVMRELRPHIAESEFVARVRRLESAGYKLAFAQVRDSIVAVAGFRVGENLAWGRFLYVDDLVTRSDMRSQGHGGRVLAWLGDYAARAGCVQLHLDSGVQRKDAHRFYQREGLTMTSYHFSQIRPDHA